MIYARSSENRAPGLSLDAMLSNFCSGVRSDYGFVT